MPVLAPKSLRNAANDLAKDESGSIAIIFALTALVMFTATGLAIDVGRATLAERALSSAIDAASLAAGKSLKNGLPDAEVEAVAQRYFEANMQGSAGYIAQVTSFSARVDRDKGSVEIDAIGEVKTMFGALAGVDKFTLPRRSVAIFDSKDIEVGLQLDVTGSMCMPCNKIDALKKAVAGKDGLLDILMPDGGNGNKVRVGLAPFAAGVNAGRYIAAVTDGRTPADGCVYERMKTGFQATEAAPTGPARLKTRADLSGESACPRPENSVVALTDSKSELTSAVEALTTDGATAGHLGASWAWGLVSPEWRDVWGGTPAAPYRDGKTEKYVILMTDGAYNTYGGISGRDAQSKNAAKATCDAMKAQGVVIFTIGFDMKPGDKDSMRYCASDAGKFKDAANEQDLQDAFRAIAEEINNLRLSS